MTLAAGCGRVEGRWQAAQAEVDALSLDDELLEPESLDDDDEELLEPESLDDDDEELLEPESLDELVDGVLDEDDEPERLSVL